MRFYTESYVLLPESGKSAEGFPQAALRASPEFQRQWLHAFAGIRSP